MEDDKHNMRLLPHRIKCNNNVDEGEGWNDCRLVFVAHTNHPVLQLSKRIPGGQKASGIFLVLYSVLPSEWREATTYQYLHYATWPFKQVIACAHLHSTHPHILF